MIELETNRRRFLLFLAAATALPSLSIAHKKAKRGNQLNGTKNPVSGRFFFAENGTCSAMPRGRFRCSAIHYFSEGTILER